MSKVKTYSIKSLEAKLKTTVDPEKRRELKLLLDDMAEVYPDESEIPDNPEEIFVMPKQWKDKSKIKRKVVMCIKGQSFSGKTFTALSASHCTEKHIRHDFKGLNEDKLNYFLQGMKRYLPFTPVWVIGTEASTYECLDSDDNEEYFEHADVRYVEVLERGSSGLSLLDHIRTYKNFLIALYSLSNQNRGTIVLDSSSSILTAQHEIVRRVINKIPSLREHQGVPPIKWFWRAVEREGIMYFGRLTPINFIFTIKQVIQSKENEKEFLKTRWWEETDRHLSSIILQNEQIGNSDVFRSIVEKCRPNKTLQNKSYQNLTIPMFMYNLINAKRNSIMNAKRKATVGENKK